ncbi:hypothetical protein SCMC78_25390 [Streptomyces sp. CMC78]|uniref:Uncharacterized protein n=1 Tax=Streptomyces sp. CMC78 TaxID=3231512 RepID=A0AB33KJK4_9ACTN
MVPVPTPEEGRTPRRNGATGQEDPVCGEMGGLAPSGLQRHGQERPEQALTVACGTEVTIPARCDRRATMADCHGTQSGTEQAGRAVAGTAIGARKDAHSVPNAPVRPLVRN